MEHSDALFYGLDVQTRKIGTGPYFDRLAQENESRH